MSWNVASMGNASGTVVSGNETYSVAPDSDDVLHLDSVSSLSARNGKFADSEDSFLFCYRTIDPELENFTIEVTLAPEPAESWGDQQSGFGIMVVDTVESPDKGCRFRNQLLVGCFGRDHGAGVRLVSGYTHADGRAHDSGRVVDESRRFSHNPDALTGVGPMRLRLEKTDEGFSASLGGEDIVIPGCDYLMQQERKAMHVGIAAARGVELLISDLSFASCPGAASHTPDGTIGGSVSDYPFPAALLQHPPYAPAELVSAGTIFAAPDGVPDGEGSEEHPTTVEQAIARALPGASIILKDGVYTPLDPLIIPAERGGTIDTPISLAAAHSRAAVLDGSNLGDDEPLMVLDADHWRIEGLVFRNSPHAGMVICGSMNRIVACEAYGNGDTGFLIISRPDAEREEWPRRNLVEDCDSHDNCDRYCSNADGFGAKLRVGAGNSFYRCVAYNNIDDGFDLYAKSLYGPAGAVSLDCCVAYGNGVLASGALSRFGGGVGFKLGGENQEVEHEAWNCLAFDNRASGFSSNSNPACRIRFCTAVRNGSEEKDDFRLFSSGEGRWITECNLQPKASSIPTGSGLVTRGPDASLAIDTSLAPIRKDGCRTGASICERKNLMFIVDSLGGGGAERVASKLVNALCQHNDVWLMYFVEKQEAYGIDPRVRLVLNASPPSKRRKTRIGRLAWKIRVWLPRISMLLRVRRLHHIDTSISLLTTANLLNALAGGNRKIVCERNDPSMKPKRYRDKSRMSFKLADYGIFQTRKVQSQFSEEVRSKSCIIPNPVEVSCHVASSHAKKIVTVGRLHPQKNHAMLIRAFAAFHAEHPEHTLHLYGDGKLLGELERLARECRVDDHVFFEGFCNDIHAAIADAQMFVLSSDYEGLSNSLIEAMMMGLPCISTACTGSDELITDGEDGILVPVGDEQALAAAMARLDSDQGLCEKLACNARIRALDFALDDVVRAWERVL